MRATLLLAPLLLLAAAPSASAFVNLCWDPADACVYSNAWEAGSGDCSSGAPDRYQFRTVRATWEHDNVTRTVEVENDCDAHARDTSHSESSDLRAHYTSYDSGTRTYSWMWLDWWGTDHSANGNTCTTRLWLYHTEPLPTSITQPDCPGRPPFAILDLP